MFHVICEQYGYDWGKFETREQAEAWLDEHTRDGGAPPHPFRAKIEERDPFETGWLFSRRYTIRKRAFELRNAKGETIGIIGKPHGRGSDVPCAYQLKHGGVSKTYTGMSLYYALTNYGKGGEVEPGAAFFIQGPDHEKAYGAIVECVKVE